jgi:LacI family transcriptional regulator
MVTINDVAEKAGVSIKTVSRVINHEPHVRQIVQDKVQEAIRQLGYKPNVSARRLASARSFLLTLLYNNPNDSYVTSITGGALSCSHDLGYGLLVESPQLEESGELESGIGDAVLATLQRNHSDGVILTPPFADNEELVRFLRRKGVPLVTVGGRPGVNRIANVLIDDAQAGYDITRHLIDAGHKRIGFISGVSAHCSSAMRQDGYTKALREASIEIDPALITSGYFDYDRAMEQAARLLDLPQPPTAIFACNDEMAAAVLAVAQQRQMQVPADLAIAGFDDTPFARAVWPQITTVRQPFAEMAAKAVQLLVEDIRNGRRLPDAPSDIYLPYELVVRGSTSA